MPELPDVTVYVEALEARILGRTLQGIRLGNPFLLRTLTPTPANFTNKPVTAIRRIGKRIAIGVETEGGELWAVLHLMIAGRLHWRPADTKLAGKNALAAFDFAEGTLTLTEAGSKRRASLHLVAGEAALAALNPGGLEVLTATLAQFASALTRENHTLKRTLTDPHLLSGIGNAYSDEILHRARLSPILLTQKLTSTQIERLFTATRASLTEWTDLLRADAKGAFPERVTAFRKEMAVHGKFGEPCPDCGTKVQRIRYAENETDYCPTCQTEGRLLADRGLSRLLKQDWPKTLDELENRKAAR